MVRHVAEIPRNERLQRAARRGMHVLAAAAALGAILELTLRMLLGLGSPLLYRTDTHFGYFPKENQHLRRFFVEIDTNLFGMRSDPVPAMKASDEYRILFVGDSVPFGTTYVDQKAIFVEQIAARLGSDAAVPRVQVLNASAPGWAPSNELEFIRARGLYHADMVVLVYNTKDLTQPFARYYGSPNFPLQNPPTAIGELWSRYLPPRILHAPVAADPGSTESEGPPSTNDAQRVLQTVEATRQLVSSQGARFVILFCPAVTADVRRYQPAWDQALLNLKNWATQQSVPVLDMTTVLTSHDAEYVYFDGIHLRQTGDQLVADAFVKWISAEFLKH